MNFYTQKLFTLKLLIKLLIVPLLRKVICNISIKLIIDKKQFIVKKLLTPIKRKTKSVREDDYKQIFMETYLKQKFLDNCMYIHLSFDCSRLTNIYKTRKKVQVN